MLRRIACCVVLAAAAAGCHSPDDYLLSPSNADHVLSVTLSATTLPADGIARVTITAQLDPRTDIDKRTVNFTTTAGTLIAAGKEGTDITVPADTNGTAVVELRSSTTPATARIDVTVASVARTATVDFLRVPRELVFDVSLSATSVPADGFSTAVITITLKRLGTPDQRAVKIDTSAGTLITSGQTNSRSVTVTAGGTGQVIVEIQSEVAGTAHLRVTALDTVYEFDITFVTLTQPEVFDVSVSSPSIPADGFSTSVITVTLKRPGGTPQQRAVKFETSAGTFIAAGQAVARVVTITADATGRAVVELQSDKTVGSARVRVTALDLPYEFTVAFTGVNPANIITVTAEPFAGPADGVTPILITATVAPTLPAGRRTVAFRTSIGTVTPAAIEADGSNVARTSVTSTTTGVARITATVDGSTAETTVQFTPALPDRVFVAADPPQVQSSTGFTSIRVTLVRSAGSMSPHLVVSYAVTTAAGAPYNGFFSGITLAEGGLSTARFNAGTGYTGPVTITATVEGAVSGTATVLIIP